MDTSSMTSVMSGAMLAKSLCNALIFSAVGVLALAVAFWVFDRLTPGNLWEEVVVKQNVSMAIVTGAMTLSLGWIIAAAVHG